MGLDRLNVARPRYAARVVASRDCILTNTAYNKTEIVFVHIAPGPLEVACGFSAKEKCSAADYRKDKQGKCVRSPPPRAKISCQWVCVGRSSDGEVAAVCVLLIDKKNITAEEMRSWRRQGGLSFVSAGLPQ